jgi:hypothetical protein
MQQGLGSNPSTDKGAYTYFGKLGRWHVEPPISEQTI